MKAIPGKPRSAKKCIGIDETLRVRRDTSTSSSWRRKRSDLERHDRSVSAGTDRGARRAWMSFFIVLGREKAGFRKLRLRVRWNMWQTVFANPRAKECTAGTRRSCSTRHILRHRARRRQGAQTRVRAGLRARLAPRQGPEVCALSPPQTPPKVPARRISSCLSAANQRDQHSVCVKESFGPNLGDYNSDWAVGRGGSLREHGGAQLKWAAPQTRRVFAARMSDTGTASAAYCQPGK